MNTWETLFVQEFYPVWFQAANNHVYDPFVLVDDDSNAFLVKWKVYLEHLDVRVQWNYRGMFNNSFNSFESTKESYLDYSVKLATMALLMCSFNDALDKDTRVSKNCCYLY